MKAFKSPGKWLVGMSPDIVGMMIATMADIALIVDRKGVIRDIAVQNAGLAREFAEISGWVGQRWVDTVTVESRDKVVAMLRAAADDRAEQPHAAERHVNCPGHDGRDVPVMFSALAIGEKGSIVAFGRDLRTIAVLQQRLIDVQQSLERDYSRLRHVETRYRILFQKSSEPMLVVDGTTQRVAEANPAAQRLFHGQGKLVGRSFADLVEPGSRATLDQMLGGVSRAGRADDTPIRLFGQAEPVHLSAFVIRQGAGLNFLIRLTPPPLAVRQDVLPDGRADLLKLIDNAPDGFVVASHDGRVIAANAAFAEMVQAASAEQVVGRSLEQWLGRPGVDLPVVTGNLRQNGAVRLYPTTLRDEFGTEIDVEISAVSVTSGGKPCYGFAIRNVAGRGTPELMRPAAMRAVPRSLEQIGELIGRVSLKDIVREATDVIERLSIEAALDITGDNRASAAEMLGLSRQSLYVKLRRYGMMDAAPASPG
ncbi:MAG TPA: transcriptional regulator PpsR [Acidiphilium sp.]|nr:transcriptional regulator PpsR [Acidiphilium sp.]